MRKWVTVMGLSYAVVFSVQNVWRATFQNLITDAYDITPMQMGVAFSLAAMPGFFSVTIGWIGSRIKLIKLFSVSFLLMGSGLIGIAFASNALVIETVGWRFNWPIVLISLLLLHSGFVTYYPTINTVYLFGVKPIEAVHRLGRLKSLGPLAGVVGATAILLAASLGGYVHLLVFAGVAIVFVWILSVTVIPFHVYARRQHRPKLNRKLFFYYLLNFLNGCRSAIFKTFVIYYLITEFHFEFKNTATIVLTGNLVNFIGYRFVGRLSKRFHPKRILVVLYFVLCCNFLGFMWAKSVFWLSILFLLDSFVFCTSAITDGYLRSVCRDKELLGGLSAGVSVYHLGGVVMPVVGGALYARSDAQVFLIGSLCSLVAIFSTRMLDWGKGGRPAREG